MTSLERIRQTIARAVICLYAPFLMVLAFLPGKLQAGEPGTWLRNQMALPSWLAACPAPPPNYYPWSDPVYCNNVIISPGEYATVEKLRTLDSIYRGYTYNPPASCGPLPPVNYPYGPAPYCTNNIKSPGEYATWWFIASIDSVASGGSGKPGGPNGSIQYNNNGAFGGFWDFNGSVIVVPGGGFITGTTMLSNLILNWQGVDGDIMLSTNGQTGLGAINAPYLFLGSFGGQLEASLGVTSGNAVTINKVSGASIIDSINLSITTPTVSITGNVGIGMSSPSTLLQIEGTTTTANVKIINSATGNNFIVTGGNNSNDGGLFEMYKAGGVYNTLSTDGRDDRLTLTRSENGTYMLGFNNSGGGQIGAIFNGTYPGGGGGLGFQIDNESGGTVIQFGAEGLSPYNYFNNGFMNGFGTSIPKHTLHTAGAFENDSTQFNNSPIDSMAGSTSGYVIFSEPQSGTAIKEIMIEANSLVGTASYTFPVPFIYTPSIFASNDLAATVITSRSTISVTITGVTSTGTIMLIGR